MTHRSWGWRIAGLGVVAALLLAACGDDDDDTGSATTPETTVADPVGVAQARVTAAEGAVTEATTAFDDASTAFCGDARTYVVAIDRYGKLFEDSATTVGDVQTAGTDLVAPREAVASSADSVLAARDDLTAAQQELADAQAALAEAQSGTSTSAPTEPVTTTTTAPLLPATTVSRVTQAETDLAAASASITEDTPLVDAGAAFNSAAFSLEIAWLRLLDDAGCLTQEERDQAVNAVTNYTVALQTELQTAGYYTGPIDGIYGPATVAAVQALQTANSLPPTGFVDRATAAALQAEVAAVGADEAQQSLLETAAVQTALKLAGYWPNSVDGEWTPELTDALVAFQTDLGVEPTGVVDIPTLQALQDKITELQTAATSTTTTEAPTTTTEAATTTEPATAAPETATSAT